MTDWIRTETALPQDGEIVDTISPGGMPQTLKRRGALWFSPDDAIYVYYVPTYWRPVTN